MMAAVLHQALGPVPEPAFVDPYAAQIEAARAKLKAPISPLYSPEQMQERQAENQRQFALGLLGQLSGNAQLSDVGGQIFKQAIAARQPKISERGTSDPLTGQFTYDPEFLRRQDETALSGLEQKSAQARASFEAARAAAAERRFQQREHDQTMGQFRAEVAESKQTAAQGKADLQSWRAEDKLRNDFDHLTKDTREELAAKNKLKSTIAGYVGRPLDAQAQQAVVVLLNKFLDPGSVVREGEFDRVVKAQGLVNIASNHLNRLMTGQFMTPQAVAQINYLAEVYTQAAEASMRRQAANFIDIATRRSLDADSVIADPRWRTGAPAAPAASASGPAVIDVGAALNRKQPAQALPKSNPKPAANRVIEAGW